MRTARHAMLRATLLLAAALAAARPVSGGTPCEEGLKAAKASYEKGFLEDIPAQLEPCTGTQGWRTGASRAQSIEAYRLLAEVNLFLGRRADARQAAAHLLHLDPNYVPSDPPALARLFGEVRREQATSQVASASKISESLRETPATVAIVTAQEIEERGYLDLEAVLHDLPGFDISRSNGQIYANLYQRGFRSNSNDRILLLVDGAEQNSFVSDIANLSRQYPVSSVERVEVVYGPASTIYGANAYSGVINVITKAPEAFVEKDRRLGADVELTAGSLATRSREVTLAGLSELGGGTVAWSLTSRAFDSSELDLSHFDGWRYDFDRVDYKGILSLTNPNDVASFCSIPGNCAPNASPLYEVRRDPQGNPVAVVLTDQGARSARQRDQSLNLHFSDPTSDVSLFGKLRLGGLSLGFEIWRTSEGSGPEFVDRLIADRTHGSVWTPRQTSFFVKYSHPLTDAVTLDFFTRYRQDDLDSARSSVPTLFTFANGGETLEDLLRGANPTLRVNRFFQVSSQFTTELSVLYRPFDGFNAIGGIELRRGSAQAQETLQRFTTPLTSFERTEIGIYGQASYQLLDALQLIAGGRLDRSSTNDNQSLNHTSSSSGYGTIFSPRLALIHSRRDFTYKAIYSEAFKDPSYLERYRQDLNGGAFINFNPNLRPERLRNFEISSGWQDAQGRNAEIALYQADFRDVVILSGCEKCPAVQFQNASQLRIRGLQASAGLKLGPSKLFFNYTLTQPFERDPRDASGQRIVAHGKELRIGDIASHGMNLGIDTPLTRSLLLDVRMNYVGPRPTGPGTTVIENRLKRIPAYAIAHATLTWNSPLPGTKLQLIVDNLFNHAYRDPGVIEVTRLSSAAGSSDQIFADSIPQPGRTVYVRLLSAFPRHREGAELLP